MKTVVEKIDGSAQLIYNNKNVTAGPLLQQ